MKTGVFALLAGIVLAAAAGGQALAQAGAARDSADGVFAHPEGGEPVIGLDAWGTMGDLIEPVWITEGLATPRQSEQAWQVPGKVLLLRHGLVSQMRLGSRYADTVQRIEYNPSTGKFEITYSYDDGRTLRATGELTEDGTFAELLTAADGSRQRNLYILDTPRRMRIVRQRHQGGWVTVSTAVKVGETPGETLAREDAERREREAIQLAERRRQEAEEARRQAEEEAYWAEEEYYREQEEYEAEEQRRRSWAIFQENLADTVRWHRDMDRSSERMMDNIRENVARHEEEQRRAEEEERRLRDQQLSESRRREEAARIEQERAARARAEQQRQQQVALAQQQQQQQQVQQQQQRQQEAEARRRAETANVLWREGVVICQPPRSGGGEWSCHGPLQTTFGIPERQSGNIAIAQACGTDFGNVRELGQSGEARTYGCGFGISPNASMRSVVGHYDPAERLGVFVPGRTTFSCPQNQTSVCKNPN